MCKVSIVVPCYNQAQYLDECLQSVLDQIYTHWECIIVNDGSEDNTIEIAKLWEYKDNRFTLIDSVNKGVSFARNLAIERASGEFILPLDADDKIANNYLSLAIKKFKIDNQLKVVYSKAEKFGKVHGNWNLEPFSLKSLALSNMIFNAGIYRKSDWASVGGYDVNMHIGLEDWEFWIALLKNGGDVCCLNETCFFYRTKHISRQVNFNKTDNDEVFKYVSVKHVDFFVKQLGSFQSIHRAHNSEISRIKFNLKSEKYVAKLFLKVFLKIDLFKK